MKKTLLTFLIVFASVLALNAKTVVVNAGDLGFTANTNLTGMYSSFTVEGIKFEVAKGNSSTEPAYNATSKEIRMYGGSTSAPAGNTLTISGAKITSIKLEGGSTCTLGELTASVGTISLDTETRTATWTGDAESVTITVNRPGSSATQYRFKTATIEGEAGAVVEYTKVKDIEEFYTKAALDSTIQFANPLNVVWQKGSNLLVTDASKYTMLIYGSVGVTYNNGDVIPAGAIGTVGQYSNIRQLTNAKVAASTSTTTVAPYVVAVKDLAGVEPYQYTYVKVENVTVTNDPANPTKVRYYQISEGDATFTVYDSYLVNQTASNATERIAEIDSLAKYNITGVLSSYGEKLQLNLITINKVGEEPPVPGEVASIEDFYKETVNTDVTFKNTLNVVYQNGNNLIVTDASGYFMLIYGSVGKSYKSGDVIPAGAKGKVGAYAGNYQLTGATLEEANGTVTIAPKTVTVAQLPDVTPYLYNYVEVKGVKITNDPANETKIRYYQISSGDATFTLYDNYLVNQASSSATERTVAIDENKTYNVIGVLGAYNSAKQLNLISFTEATGINSVEADNDAPAMYYNLSGVAVDAASLTPGIYICKKGSKTTKILVK